MRNFNMPRIRLSKNPEPRIRSALVTWDKIRDHVKKVNPVLVEIIDRIAPPYSLELKKFDYGYNIANYKSVPEISIVLEKNCELFFDYQGKKQVYRVYKAGEIMFAERRFGLTDWFYLQPFWNLTAGCRNVFMVPSITDQRSHSNLLKNYEINIEKPEALEDQWEVFKAIANSKVIKEEECWQASILTFTGEWFNHIDDPVWSEFYRYMEHSVIKQTDTLRQKPFLEMLFGMVQHERPIKIKLPQFERTSHLLLLGLNGVPGFRAADETMMPYQIISNAYLNAYHLKDYAPVIMGPDYFDFKPGSKSGKSLYYSFHHETSYLISPKSNQRKTLVQDLEAINWTLDKMRGLMLNQKFIPENSTLHHLMEECQFNFYHQEAETYKAFKLPEQILEDDPELLKPWNNLDFQARNQFLNGCVRISKVRH